MLSESLSSLSSLLVVWLLAARDCFDEEPNQGVILAVIWLTRKATMARGMLTAKETPTVVFVVTKMNVA